MTSDARVQESVATGTALPVMEHFYTLQGEGAHQGKAAYFIRLAGCDVGCVWCDVKESWETEGHPVRAVSELVQYVQATDAPNVVITGGEPAMYPLEPLTTALQQAGKQTWMETSGAHPITGQWNWVCLSQKKFKPCLEQNYPLAHELKVVIANRNDFAWAETHAARVPDTCRLFLQPEWSREAKLLPAIIAYVKQHPQWAVSLQTHKYMDIP